MTIRSSITAAVLAAGLASVSGQAFAQDPITLKYATLYSATDFYEVASKHFIEEVTKRSKDRKSVV